MDLKPLSTEFPIKVHLPEGKTYQDWFRFTKKLSKEEIVETVRKWQRGGTKIDRCIPFKEHKTKELISYEILKQYYRYLGYVEAYLGLDLAEKAQEFLLQVMFLQREVFQAFWEEMRIDSTPNLVGELLYVRTPNSMSERVDYWTVFDTLWAPLTVDKAELLRE